MSNKTHQKLIGEVLHAVAEATKKATTKAVNRGCEPRDAWTAAAEALSVALAAVHCDLVGLDEGAIEGCAEAICQAASGFAEELELGAALDCYTDPNHPEFDPDFNEKIRKIRPDWFGDNSKLN